MLPGNVTADNKLGAYRCKAMEPEHPGVLKVPCEGVPDVGIELIEADIPPPEIVSDWEWGSGTVASTAGRHGAGIGRQPAIRGGPDVSHLGRGPPAIMGA